MIALIARLDPDFGQAVAVEQMPSQLATGAGKIFLAAVMAGEHPLHPPLGAQDQYQERQYDCPYKKAVLHIRLFSFGLFNPSVMFYNFRSGFE